MMKNQVSIALWLAKKNRFGGFERRILRILNQVADDQKYHVRVLVKEIDMTDEGRNNIKSFFPKDNRITFFKKQLTACFHILTHHYDWLCVSDITRRSVLVMRLAKLRGDKILFSSVAASASNLIFHNKAKEKLFYLMIALSDHVDCLYPNAIPILRETFPKKSISQTPGSFTDFSRYTNMEAKKKIVAFASRLEAGKNVMLFLDAICHCANDFRNAGYSAILCGDGKIKNEAETFIQKKEIGDICSCVGFVDTAPVFAEAQVFCSLQDITNYPSQSLIEAEASGCYCIVTDTGESHLMIDSSFGILIPAEAAALREALAACVDFSEKRWDAIRRQARAFAEKHYSIEASVEYFKRIYDGNCL